MAGRCAAGASLALGENDLDIGQTPTEPYSASKIDAERSLRGMSAFEDSVSVLRVGTVAPHSLTGRFQRNIDAHFFSRWLRGILSLGVAGDLPGREFRLIPADAMADAVFTLSAAASSRGRTFHLQTEHALSHAGLCALIRELGWDIELLPAADFVARVTSWGSDPARAEDVGRLLPWLVERPDRPVALDTRWTDERLLALGFRYPAPSAEWVGRFVGHGVSVGYLPRPRRGAAT